MKEEERTLTKLWIRASVCHWYYCKNIIDDYEYDRITETLKHVYKSPIVKHMVWGDGAWTIAKGKRKVVIKTLDEVDKYMKIHLDALKLAPPIQEDL